MKLGLTFAKRNFTEMLRDPVMYIFCIGFPVVLIVLFSVINCFTQGNTPVFEPLSLIPGIIIFSYTFVMLTGALLVSKDRTSAFLIRLYTSPMNTFGFVIGYILPLLTVGVAQFALCTIAGGIAALASGAAYFGFVQAILILLSSLPALLMCICLGIIFGCLFNDKAAPGLCSVIISIAGVLGGAWMPIDTMGGFETFCRVLPFYPSVYIGRIIAGAEHMTGVAYTFDGVAGIGLITVFVWLAVSAVAALLSFRKKSSLE